MLILKIRKRVHVSFCHKGGWGCIAVLDSPRSVRWIRSLMWAAEERPSFFNTVKSCQLSCRVATRVHALIGCRKFGKQVQAPSLQRGELFAAREQRVINNIGWIGKPAFRLLFGRISVEGLCFGQKSLHAFAISHFGMSCA